MAPNNPIELLMQMSAEDDRLNEEFDRLMAEGDPNKEEFRQLHARNRQESCDVWDNIMEYVLEVRETHQEEADAFMRDRHGMTWATEYGWSGYSC